MHRRRQPGLPDGNYYFQVTDANGAQLLSTDPVSNRQFHVSGGIITAYIGTGGAPHPTGFDQDHLAEGAITIGLANGSCPNDYLTSPSAGEVYKVWVTPVASFIGNPANVDNPCSGNCSHGFVHSQSKTDNFKVQAGSSATFCLTVEKKLSNAGVLTLAQGWPITALDPSGSQIGGITVTGTNGDTATVCQLGPGTYTVTEGSGPVPAGSVVTGTQVFLNGTLATTGVSMTFTWDGTQPANIMVLFVNAIGTIG